MTDFVIGQVELERILRHMALVALEVEQASQVPFPLLASTPGASIERQKNGPGYLVNGQLVPDRRAAVEAYAQWLATQLAASPPRPDNWILPFTLTERDSEAPDLSVRGFVVCERGALDLFFEHYGVAGIEPPHGAPVFFELYNGELRALLWEDLEYQDPRVISLAAAHEPWPEGGYLEIGNAVS
jgi:hypothetical protein